MAARAAALAAALELAAAPVAAAALAAAPVAALAALASLSRRRSTARSTARWGERLDGHPLLRARVELFLVDSMYLEQVDLEHHLEQTGSRRVKVILPIAPIILELCTALFGSLGCFLGHSPGVIHRALVDIIAQLPPFHERFQPMEGVLSVRFGFDETLWDRRLSTDRSSRINIPRRDVRKLGMDVCVRSAFLLRPKNCEIIPSIDDLLRNVAQGDEELQPCLSSIGVIAVGSEIALHGLLKLRIRSFAGRRSTDSTTTLSPLRLILSLCVDLVPSLRDENLPVLRLPPFLVDLGHDLVLEVAGDNEHLIVIVANHDPAPVIRLMNTGRRSTGTLPFGPPPPPKGLDHGAAGSQGVRDVGHLLIHAPRPRPPPWSHPVDEHSDW